MIDWHIKARTMRESGAKTKDIATILGKGHSAVRQALAAYCGVKVKCPVDHLRATRTWTADRKSEFAALFQRIPEWRRPTRPRDLVKEIRPAKAFGPGTF
jgi:hypothetical protein